MPEYPVSHCENVNFILHATDRMVYNKLVCNYIWILDYTAYSLHCKSKDRLNEEAAPISITLTWGLEKQNGSNVKAGFRAEIHFSPRQWKRELREVDTLLRYLGVRKIKPKVIYDWRPGLRYKRRAGRSWYLVFCLEKIGGWYLHSADGRSVRKPRRSRQRAQFLF